MLSSISGRDQPIGDEALLLRMILTDQPDRMAGWRRWSQRVDFERLAPVIQDLLPALYKTISPLVPDDPLLNRMRGVYKRTWTHNLNALRVAISCCQMLERAGIDTMLFKGVSLLADYDTPGLRPMGDVDVLVPRSRVNTAIDVLLDDGWRPFPFCGRSRLQNVIVRRLHGWSFLKYGVNVDLHWQTLHKTVGREDDVCIWENRCEATLFGIPARIPSASDRLLYALAHGADTEGRRRVTWILDAAQILGSHSNAIDWAEFRAKASRMALDVLVRDLLGILRDRFDLPVPDPAIPAPGRVRTLLLRRVVRTPGRLGPQAQGFTALSRITAHSEAAWGLLYRLHRPLHRPTPVPWELPELPPGRVIRFGKGGSGLEFTAGGWAQPETQWTWSDSRQARLIFTTQGDGRTPLRLRLAASPYLPAGCGEARFRCTLNGEDQGPISFERAYANAGISLFVLPGSLCADRRLELVVNCFSAARPGGDRADSNDNRLLGIRLSSMCLEEMTTVGAAFEVGFAAGEAGAAWLGHCWWRPESTGTWSANRRATLLVPLSEAPGEHGSSRRLGLELSPAPGMVGSGRLEVLVSGSASGRHTFHLDDTRRQWLELDISTVATPPGTAHLRIMFSVDNPVIPNQHGISADGRSLGIHLHRLALSNSTRGRLPRPV